MMLSTTRPTVRSSFRAGSTTETVVFPFLFAVRRSSILKSGLSQVFDSNQVAEPCDAEIVIDA